MTTRELGLVRQTVEEATGLEVSHFYDDLVFVDLGVFLIRFDNAVPGKIHVHFQHDCESAARVELLNNLTERALANGLTLASAGDFVLEPSSTAGELNLHFHATID